MFFEEKHVDRLVLFVLMHARTHTWMLTTCRLYANAHPQLTVCQINVWRLCAELICLSPNAITQYGVLCLILINFN
jgi:hypothetical protein